MAGGGKVNWYGNRVTALVEAATDDILEQIAFYVEGAAKTRAPVDTGFMRNAIYSVTPSSSNRDKARAEAGGSADRPLAPPPGLGDKEAAVHGAAHYTIYQENAVGFMHGGLEDASGAFPGIVRTVGGKHLG